MVVIAVEFRIDPENIFICGFSQGGALTLASVLLYPTKLGGGAIFSGWLPLNPSSIVEKISQEAKKTPILWSHGIDDRIVLFESGQAAVSFLKQIDMNCELKSYPGLGHSINNEELKSLESWIKAHFKVNNQCSGNQTELGITLFCDEVLRENASVIGMSFGQQYEKAKKDKAASTDVPISLRLN